VTDVTDPIWLLDFELFIEELETISALSTPKEKLKLNLNNFICTKTIRL